MIGSRALFGVLAVPSPYEAVVFAGVVVVAVAAAAVAVVVVVAVVEAASGSSEEEIPRVVLYERGHP